MILESRDLTNTTEDRRRILACRDPDELERWTRRAFAARSVDELWKPGS